jgi:hypothetical protein
LNIVQLVVQQQLSSAEWKVAWELQGKRSLRSIAFGAKYEGLIENVAATPLLKGARYRVLASSQAQLGPIAHSAAYFTFNEAGDVQVTNP